MTPVPHHSITPAASYRLDLKGLMEAAKLAAIMGLADRFYMRDAYHAPRMTTRLIIVLIVAFVAQSVLLFYGDFQIAEHLALSVDGLRHGKVWQLLTFQFLHSCPWPWHVLFNCLGLYFFGRPVEEMLGEKKFLLLYFLSGTFGGLLQVLVTAVLPRHMDIPVVGASAGVCGMIAIFCSVNPMEELTTWIYFLPITVRARYFLWFVTGFSVFGTLVPFGGIAHGAHLGGILVGLGYVRFARRMWDELPAWVPGFGRRRARAAVPGSKAKNTRRRTMTREEKGATEFMSREVDPILEKISAQGLHSLTEKERKILEAARQRISR